MQNSKVDTTRRRPGYTVADNVVEFTVALFPIIVDPIARILVIQSSNYITGFLFWSWSTSTAKPSEGMLCMVTVNYSQCDRENHNRCDVTRLGSTTSTMQYPLIHICAFFFCWDFVFLLFFFSSFLLLFLLIRGSVCSSSSDGTPYTTSRVVWSACSAYAKL